jgi:5-methylcytosine-specific restriction enzyme subunit McrC
MSSNSLTLSEWETASPSDPGRAFLQGFTLSADGRLAAEALTRTGRLEIAELVRGLSIQSTSYVGRLTIDDLTITIWPKIGRALLVQLVRYALGLHQLTRLDDTSYGAGTTDLIDLIVAQLNGEVLSLLTRGLHRSYEPTKERLSSPRGRIDLQTIARTPGRNLDSLPCRHFPRLADNILNRMVLFGVRQGARLAMDRSIRNESFLLASILEGDVRTGTLTDLHNASMELDRRTAAYEPILQLVELLAEGQSLTFEDQPTIALPGVLFDMNRLFQALLDRFLKENLVGYEVRSERRIMGMLRYVRGQNPRAKHDPAPRPDFVVLNEGHVVTLLDAKYRDLWERALPREMLYQLALYAISHPTSGEAIILFPTMDGLAIDQRLEIRDPVSQRHLAEVVVRPVNVPHLVSLVQERDFHARARYAKQLVLGDQAQ